MAKVLHVIDTSAVGGGQAAVRHLIAGFAGSRVGTELACRGGGPLVDAARELGATVHDVPFDKRYLPGCAARLGRIVRDRGIDLLHTHGLLATYYASMARVFFGARVPLVYQQHGFHHWNHGPLTRGPRRAAERALCRAADRVIAASTGDRKVLCEEGYGVPERIRLIHYGIPRPSFEPGDVRNAAASIGARPGQPVVGIVGRLHPQKAVDVFLRAAAQVRREVQDAVFPIVGGGPLDDALRALARDLGLDGAVRWCGNRPGVPFASQFTVGVISSRWEGLPFVLLEYMALALPIVATAIDGCLEAAGPEHAELVPAGDAHALAEAIIGLLRDRELAQRKARCAFSRFNEEFTRERMVERVADLYREVMS